MDDTSTLTPPAPVLVLIDEPSGVRPDVSLLGLSLLRRAALAARRAGYARTIVISADRALGDLAQDPDEFTVVGGWGDVEEAQACRLVVAGAQIVGEAGWLEQARHATLAPGGWAHAPSGLVIIDTAAGAALAALARSSKGAHQPPPPPRHPHGTRGMGGLSGERAGADFKLADSELTLESVCRRLTESLGAAEAMPAAVDAFHVRVPADLAVARKRLLRSLVKDSDGFMARHVERPISLMISRWLAETAITPNQMTLISLAVGVAGAPFFLSAQPLWQTVGALLFLVHSILDGCDGELARLKYQESRWGGLLDFWGDNVVHVAVFACMAVGWSIAVGAAWPLVFGAAGVLGTIASAGLVYWRVLRDKSASGPLFTSVAVKTPHRLTRLLDAASRRDFIYLVIALSLFGKASWFLVASAIGAPAFFILLVVVALRERRRP
jgi:phosphatidylglycerophosphate synthase